MKRHSLALGVVLALGSSAAAQVSDSAGPTPPNGAQPPLAPVLGCVFLQPTFTLPASLAGKALTCDSSGALRVAIQGNSPSSPTYITRPTGTMTATYPSGTSGTLIAANPNRKSLRWMNIGAADITVAPGTTPPTVGQGMVYTANGAGKQGASETINDPSMVTNAFSFSAASSANIVVWEAQ